MSLINLQTGASAAEEMNLSEAKKIISDLQTRIYKQDLLIRKLNDEANQMQRQNCNPKEIELLKSKLNKSENDKRELSETVTRAENKIKDLQLELDRKNKNPLQVKYEYLSRCYNCKIDEYEKISLDAENAKQQAEKTCEEAEKQRKYFYYLVNNYNAEIDKRVEKIIERKTRFQRFVDWLEKLISMVNSAVFFVPFLYAVGITVLAVCSSVKKKAKLNRPNRINRQEGAKKEPNFCTNFQNRQAKGNRSDCECEPCCKKRRCIQKPACKHAENPLS